MRLFHAFSAAAPVMLGALLLSPAVADQVPSSAPASAVPNPSSPSNATQRPESKPSIGAASTSATEPEPAANVTVTGFRSAQFGMDETAVRAAIARDFGKSVVIKTSTNAAERTNGLSINAPNVLPEGGSAEANYVFGYKSKKLIQVSLLWSKAADPATTEAKLLANADVLRATFLEQGYKPDTVLTNVAVRNGLIMFRGSDADGHTTALILEGRVAVEKDKKSFTPVSLLLLYIADPKHADVFRLKPGQF